MIFRKMALNSLVRAQTEVHIDRLVYTTNIKERNDMEIFNRNNSKNTGDLKILTSHMLISPQNSSAQNLSIQISLTLHKFYYFTIEPMPLFEVY